MIKSLKLRNLFSVMICMLLSASLLASSVTPTALRAEELQPESGISDGLPAEEADPEDIDEDIPEEEEPEEEDSEEEEILEESAGLLINPFWEDVFTAEELESLISEPQTDEEADRPVRPGGPLKSQAKTTFTTYNEMVECLRNALIGRKTSVQINFDVPGLAFDSGTELGTRLYEDALSKMNPYQAAMVPGLRINASTYSGKTHGRGYLRFTMNAYFNTDEQEEEFERELRDCVDALNIYAADDYTKIETIYEFIINHVKYDYPNLNDHSYMLKYTAYAALINQTAVCQGYSLLLYRMASMAGLNVRYITGQGIVDGTGGNHAWNAVMLDGKYYLLDSTWDSSGWYPKYFLRGTENFNTDHEPGIRYPVDESYSTTDYVIQQTYGVDAQTVILTPSSESIYAGAVLYLSAEVLPENAIDKRLTWTSGDDSIATVNENGAVTGVSSGTVTIYATTTNSIVGTAEVTVVGDANYVDVTGFELTGTAGANGYIVAQYNSGAADPLTWRIHPENATDQTVTLRTDDPSIATIDAQGMITCVKPGLTSIYAYPNGRTSENLAVLCQLQVAGVQFGTDAVDIQRGDRYTFENLTVFPVNTTIHWSTSDGLVATVDQNGVITGVGDGSCTITAKTLYGAENSQTIPVTVRIPKTKVDGVTLDRNKVSLEEGESTLLEATVSPPDADETSVTWKSGNTSVAKVDANGSVTALKEGKATITVTTKDGGHTAKCEVTVKKAYIPVTYLEILNANEGRTHVQKGKEKKLEVYLSPDNATNQSLTWKSENESIFTVSQKGVIKGITAGSAKLVVSSADGVSLRITVVVKVSSTEVQLNKTAMTLTVGNSKTLTATVKPDDTTDTSVSWKSSDQSVATVDANGRVTAVKKGSATITVTTNDVGNKKSCTVTVKEPVSPNPPQPPQPPKPVLQTCDSNPALAWEHKNGKSYWYENGVKQAVAGDPKNITDKVYGYERGREIYDPCSDGWYWLDSIYDGAKAENKEVWMPYIYQDEAKWSDRDIVRVSLLSGGQSGQVIDAIHSREGKWVRYDSKGKMVKGWYTVTGADAKLYPTQAGNTYYYDRVTGLMAKGWIVIDGVKYHFDEVSGALKR